ncbi:MAG: hypothetical protein GY729_06990 [Desulfobacteraceae bacterium]|nr:hypothetical protein [Desulfobacteraceae bacterium]
MAQEKIKLIKPISHDGKKLKEVSLDLDGLTGLDMAEAEREYLLLGGVPTNLNLSIAYLQHVAAKGCKIDVETVRRMGVKDSQYLVVRTQAFLLDMELPSASKTSGSSV